MANAAEVNKEIYNPQKIDALHQAFENSLNNNGKYKEYQIEVDGFPVVPKCNDPNRFMDYVDFINLNSQSMSILMYKSNYHKDKFIFYFGEDPSSHAHSLKGIPEKKDNSLNEEELIAKGRREKEFEHLQKENLELKEDLDSYQKELDTAYRLLNEEREKNETGILKYLPYLVELKGLIMPQSQNGLSGTPGADNSGAFTRKDSEAQDDEEEAIKLTDQQKFYISYMERLRQRVGDVRMENIIHVVELCAAHPDAPAFAVKSLTRFLEGKKNEAKNNGSSNSQGSDKKKP